MKIETKRIGNVMVTEYVSDDIILRELQDALDLIGNCYYREGECVLIHKENIIPEFFDLSTKIAGEILQKFTQYEVRLAIIGEFDGFESKSLPDFIRESNRQGHVLFLSSIEELERRFAD